MVHVCSGRYKDFDQSKLNFTSYKADAMFVDLSTTAATPV